MISHDERIAQLTFTAVYPHYVNKVIRKGRSVQELHAIITWLTAYDESEIINYSNETISFEQFFENANLNPNANLITGVICGYRVEDIQNPLSQKVRYLDKLVDELANGRKLEKILRENPLK